MSIVALSQICSLRSTHTAAHTVHCCTLPHTMHTAAHNVHNTQHVQVAPTTTNGLLHASNAYSNQSNRREVSMHLDGPIRLEGFARRSHIWWFADIAVEWHGGSGSSHTHTNRQLTKRGDLHQRGDNQSRFPRAPSPVAPNPKTALNHKMTRVQQYISLAPIPQEQKTAADSLNLGVTVFAT